MEDNQIIELYWNKNEKAISETDKKYGKYCNYIAYNILQNAEDSNECVNDTYLRTWNTIPPQSIIENLREKPEKFMEKYNKKKSKAEEERGAEEFIKIYDFCNCRTDPICAVIF